MTQKQTISIEDYLNAKKLIFDYEKQQLCENKIVEKPHLGGIDKYFYDLENW